MNPQTSLAVEARGLVKSFGTTQAVDGVDLVVRRGSVYGVLGPNGAGKTTTIRMLATLLRPDAGSARILGHDLVTESDAVRRSVSLTGQLASVDEDLSGRENLILLGRLLGLGRSGAKRRADELLDAFGLSAAEARLVKHYSGGMRRRLDIAASIVVTPELMFLDEPTTGLDPRSRNQVWDIVRAMVDAGDDGAAVHPVPRGGGPARRGHRRHRPRPGHRRGHPRPAEGLRRLGHPARPPAGSGSARGRAPRAGSVPRPGDGGTRSRRAVGALSRAGARGRGRRRARPGPASVSAASRSASRASTRCSWP